MSGLTTHVLDAVRGGGAVGIALVVSRREPEGFRVVAEGLTDANGRAVLLAPGELPAGLYEIVFATRAYLAAQGAASFFDDVAVRFRVDRDGAACHVPIVVAPAAYSAYRGGVPPVGDAALPPELAR